MYLAETNANRLGAAPHPQSCKKQRGTHFACRQTRTRTPLNRSVGHTPSMPAAPPSWSVRGWWWCCCNLIAGAAATLNPNVLLQLLSAHESQINGLHYAAAWWWWWWMVYVCDSHGFVVRPCGSLILLLATAAHLLLHWLVLDALQTARGASANVGVWKEPDPFSGASCIGRA